MKDIKKIVVKVNVNCKICKTNILKVLAKVSGIDMLAVDCEKGLLTVEGDVDPVSVVGLLRKAGKVAQLVSVQPKKASGPTPQPERKPDPAPSVIILPQCCNQCELVAAASYDYYDDRGGCNIL